MSKREHPDSRHYYPSTRRDRPGQEPPPPRPETPEASPSSTIPRSGQTPNRDDPFPPPQGRNARTGPPLPPSNRKNEYFVPRDGIDKDVITADITRYLGNDALVRPGNYENPAAGTVQAGYFITAYRNLTSEMIADLKADSARWDAERKISGSRGQSVGAEYRASTTHESRQYYGPTGIPSSGFAPPQSQPSPASYGGNQYGSIDRQPSGYYSAPSPQSYPQPGYGQQQAPAYSDSHPTQYHALSTPAYQDSRSTTAYYGQSAPGNVAGQQQQVDPYYGRGSYDPPSDLYEAGGYAQTPSQSNTPATAPPSYPRDRDSNRDRRHH